MHGPRPTGGSQKTPCNLHTTLNVTDHKVWDLLSFQLPFHLSSYNKNCNCYLRIIQGRDKNCYIVGKMLFKV